MVRCYLNMEDYYNALSCSQRVLQIYERVLGPNHTETKEIRSSIAMIQEKCRKVEESREMEVITLTPTCDDSPAQQQGMEGEYIILEFNGWQIGNEDVFPRIYEENKENPKSIVLIQNDIITRHHFDGRIGALLESKKLDKKEKEKLKEAYLRWKRLIQ